MEAFEKAHMKKKTSNSHLKRHFKQLLDGYKDNNTQAIKSANEKFENTSSDSEEKLLPENLPYYDSNKDSDSSICTDDASDILSSDNEYTQLEDNFLTLTNTSMNLTPDKNNTKPLQNNYNQNAETIKVDKSKIADNISVQKVSSRSTKKCKITARQRTSTNQETSEEDDDSQDLVSENEDGNSTLSTESDTLDQFDEGGKLAMNIKKQLNLNVDDDSTPGKYVLLKRKIEDNSETDKIKSIKIHSQKTVIVKKPNLKKTKKNALDTLEKSQIKHSVQKINDVLEKYKFSPIKHLSYENNEHSFLNNINEVCEKSLNDSVIRYGNKLTEYQQSAEIEVTPSSSIKQSGTTNTNNLNTNVQSNDVQGTPVTQPVRAVLQQISIAQPTDSIVPPNVPQQVPMLMVNPAILLNTPSILITSVIQQDENSGAYMVRNQISNNEVENNEVGINTEETGHNPETTSNIEMMSDIAISDFSADEAEEEKNVDEARIKIYYHKTTCIFVLKHPAELYIHGKVKVKCLAGRATISGYTLTDKFSEIYAPNFNYSQHITTISNENVYYGLFNKLSSIGLSVNTVEELVISLGKQDVVLCFEPLKNKKYDFMEKYFTKANIFSKINKNVDPFLWQASQLLGCSLYSKQPLKYFAVNPVWEETLKVDNTTPGQNIDYIINPVRGLIVGGKRVGKSTFLKYYVNQKLSSGPVLVIDLDPGQCELTVAGNISATIVDKPLLGPNFTHLTKPDIMLNVGEINTMNTITRYIKSVSQLLNYCYSKQEFKKLPWIVNTMGLCNCVGQMFIIYTILKLKPTFILQLESKSAKKSFDFHMTTAGVIEKFFKGYHLNDLFVDITSPERLHYKFFLSTQEDLNIKHNLWLAPKDERYLSFLSYFGEMLLQSRNNDFFSIVPYEVPFENISVISNIDIVEADLYAVLNGKIVGLCGPLADCPKVMKFHDSPIKCYGYGLIRGMDATSGRLYIMTPVLEVQAPVLLYADWTPELIMQPNKGLGTPVPYRAQPQQGNYQLLQPPQRRLNPLQLLKMIKSPLDI